MYPVPCFICLKFYVNQFKRTITLRTTFTDLAELQIRILYASRKNDGKTLIEQRSLEG